MQRRTGIPSRHAVGSIGMKVSRGFVKLGYWRENWMNDEEVGSA
jgi:hypothetical protein